MRTPWRRWLPGPKHGIARGAAVFGASGAGEPARLLELLGRCELLRARAGSHGIALDDEPGSLPALDGQVDAWSTDPGIGPRLGNEVGCYLGTVIVRHVPGAVGRAWPNGHPVVRLPSARDLDVIAQAERRVTSHHGTLTSIYTAAR
ncbi:MAG: DUF6278 family protein [Trebonia sp.]